MPDMTKHKLSPSQRRELERFAERIIRFGVNFAVVDESGEIAVLMKGAGGESDPQSLIEAARSVLDAAPDPKGRDEEIPVRLFGDCHVLLAAPLSLPATFAVPRQAVGVAIIDLGRTGTPSGESCASLAASPDAAQAYFTEMLRLMAQNFVTAVRSDEQMEKMGIELAQVYEELVLLHRISTNMRVTESDTNFLQLACDSLTETILVEGIAILLERVVDGEKRFVVAAGSGLIDLDSRMAAVLHSRLVDELRRGQEALLDSEVDTPFRFEWPGNIRSIIAVPLCAKEAGDGGPSRSKAGLSVIGFMVAINRLDKADFDSTDIKLFASVAGGCAVFIENGRLFNDLKELFVGSLKALTSSIDAKDPYTRGHSERVAIISRWIAERLAEKEPLDAEQIHRIYLAGLLHDIGKIGINESVLCKNGRLTPEERVCIQRHPAIGASILRGIKQMRDIVPGVLYHHERIDGKGYPSGVPGEAVPLTGRIIAIADSFDAMTSKRVYRDAMSVEQAVEEIRKGLGTQFDEKIGRVFLGSDMNDLWDLIQGGNSALQDNADPADYGTAAVGTLLT
jgi:HD-GYP domain-containing protein (c-di-GMP phosphodiesterase class II)